MSDTPVGVALSGGGIRSATFCLGLFQALACKGLLSKIDILSTVSGGGYFGCFLGGLFMRPESFEKGKTLEESLCNPYFAPTCWLRENGRYLSPNGAGDSWLAGAVALRNWVALHVVMLTFAFLVMVWPALARIGLRYVWPSTTPGTFYFHYTINSPCQATIWWSPTIYLPVVTFLLLLVPTGGSYWLTQVGFILTIIKSSDRIFCGHFQGLSDAEILNRVRNLLSRGLAVGLLMTLGLATYALVDSLGQTLYLRWADNHFSVPWKWAGASSTGLALLGLGSKILTVLEKLPKRRAFKIPLGLIALLVAVVWTAVIFLSMTVLVNGFVWHWLDPSNNQTAETIKSCTPLVCAAIFSSLLCMWFGRIFGFVNLCSHQQLYAARLKRAYLGASNPERQKETNNAITNPMPGDDIELEKYQPHLNGGPLHLVNVTVNETVSGKSQVEQRDRKGLGMTVGPCGISVGVHDHAMWDGESRARIKPIPNPGGRGFHSLAADGDTARDVERLELGNWISVSGAAVSTGMGVNTSLGVGMLLGLANVRLGYWWDSHIYPQQRAQRTPPGVVSRVGEFLARILPVQSALLDEFLVRFHGPARRHWYLSDGGHFENTACYELVRRRVPFIIVSDNGEDASYQFADIANLVRKARVDFNAEIEFLTRRPTGNTTQSVPADSIPYLEDVVHPSLLDVIGTQEDVLPFPDANEHDPGTPNSGARNRRRHAMLARVRFLDSSERSWILFIKPSLTGDEPTDVLEYQKEQDEFPQESTVDQFFDEAQWESYRRLGAHIGDCVFAAPPDIAGSNGANWSPREMRAPQA